MLGLWLTSSIGSTNHPLKFKLSTLAARSPARGLVAPPASPSAMTDYKEAYHALRSQHSELQRQYHERTEELKRTNVQLSKIENLMRTKERLDASGGGGGGAPSSAALRGEHRPRRRRRRPVARRHLRPLRPRRRRHHRRARVRQGHEEARRVALEPRGPQDHGAVPRPPRGPPQVPRLPQGHPALVPLEALGRPQPPPQPPELAALLNVLECSRTCSRSPRGNEPAMASTLRSMRH